MTPIKPGTYTIVSDDHGLAAAIHPKDGTHRSGRLRTIDPKGPSALLRWSVTETKEGFFRIALESDGKKIWEDDHGSELVKFDEPDPDLDEQEWRLTAQPNGSYSIQHHKTGRYASIEPGEVLAGRPPGVDSYVYLQKIPPTRASSRWRFL